MSSNELCMCGVARDSNHNTLYICNLCEVAHAARYTSLASQTLYLIVEVGMGLVITRTMFHSFPHDFNMIQLMFVYICSWLLVHPGHLLMVISATVHTDSSYS